MHIGEKLSKLRKAGGVSQETLADGLGVSRQTVSKWETGAAYPDGPNIKALCAFFGVGADYFFADEAVLPAPRAGAFADGNGMTRAGAFAGGEGAAREGAPAAEEKGARAGALAKVLPCRKEKSLADRYFSEIVQWILLAAAFAVSAGVFIGAVCMLANSDLGSEETVYASSFAPDVFFFAWLFLILSALFIALVVIYGALRRKFGKK